MYVGTKDGRLRIFEKSNGKVFPVLLYEGSSDPEAPHRQIPRQRRLSIKVNDDPSSEKSVSFLEVSPNYIAVGTKCGHVKVFSVSARKYFGTESAKPKECYRELRCVYHLSFDGKEVLCCSMYHEDGDDDSDETKTLEPGESPNGYRFSCEDSGSSCRYAQIFHSLV